MTRAEGREMTYTATTTLAAIRAKSPCREGWEKLLSHLGKTQADDEPLHLLTILDSNGLDDCLWVLQQTGCDKRLSRHFGAWCAEQVLPIFEAERPGDMRPRQAIAVARDDNATEEQRDAARYAARAAARAAARDAAGAAAWGRPNKAIARDVDGGAPMTVHNIRDYSPDPKTAANSVYEPEAPMILDAETFDDPRPPDDMSSELLPVRIMLAAIFLTGLAWVLVDLLPIGGK
jgi:hypothetical protein